ncbi:MAG: hypothetical protein U5K51_16620 [Flavobacteriaceae bacterium]|nr:hypothetical protein [Flavobacteriaceae bacterium]
MAYLYVNLEGGYGFNNQVVVIDLKELKVVKNIPVGDVPNSINEDLSGNIWVLCGGKPDWTGVKQRVRLIKISSR